jgi:hypothetical protein
MECRDGLGSRGALEDERTGANTLEDMLDRIEEKATTGGRTSLADVLAAVGSRSFGRCCSCPASSWSLR